MESIELQASVTLPNVNYVQTSHKVGPKQTVSERPPSAERTGNQDNVPKLIKKIDRFVESLSTKISFSVDNRTGKSIILVTEKETGNVVRQIPPEEMLELASKMEEISGIIFNGRV